VTGDRRPANSTALRSSGSSPTRRPARTPPGPKDRYRLVVELHADGVRVGRACHALGVSRSGYHDWRTRPPSARQIRHAWLTDLIGTIHQASRATYGAPRVHAELVHGRGVVVGHNTIGLLVRRAGLTGLPRPRRGLRIKRLPTVTDLVRRDFHRARPKQLWVTDITEHPTREGKLYCCVVIDAYSRRVVGWAIDSRQQVDLATNALGMAIDSRGAVAGGIIHGDHGVRFTSWAFTERARKAGLLPSLGSVGDPYDNAMVESLWDACRPNYSTGKAGGPASSSPTRSSSTSQASTTDGADTQPSAGEAP
jgi:transposase InsO family protein